MPCQALHVGLFAVLSRAEQVLIPWSTQPTPGQRSQGLISNPPTLLTL